MISMTALDGLLYVLASGQKYMPGTVNPPIITKHVRHRSTNKQRVILC